MESPRGLPTFGHHVEVAMAREWCWTVVGFLILDGAAARASTPGSPAEEPEAALELKVSSPGQAGTFVRRAIRGAQRRLAQDKCRAVLTEFADESSGRTLNAILVEKGQIAEDYLATLVFRGTEAPACAAAFAGTRPGGAVVYICERRFTDLARRRQAMAEAIIIHEMMHTLGLGENPPTSQEITARVMQRCGGF